MEQREKGAWQIPSSGILFASLANQFIGESLQFTRSRWKLLISLWAANDTTFFWLIHRDSESKCRKVLWVCDHEDGLLRGNKHTRQHFVVLFLLPSTSIISDHSPIIAYIFIQPTVIYLNYGLLCKADRKNRGKNLLKYIIRKALWNYVLLRFPKPTHVKHSFFIYTFHRIHDFVRSSLDMPCFGCVP